jgi:hypothetical protein
VVSLYQIGILALIVIASTLFGEKGMWLAAAASAIWTLVTVFTSWLMILQFVTIFVGLAIIASICGSSEFKNIQGNAWGLIVAAVIGGIWLYNKNEGSTTGTNPETTAAVQSPSTKVNRRVQGNAEFNAAIDDAMSRYPALNEDSNPRLFNLVVDRANYYMQPGSSSREAVRRAVNDYAGELVAANTRQTPPLASIPTFPNGGNYGAMGLDPAEMRRMNEEVRQTGLAFDAAQRTCGSAPTHDMSAFDRWSACMSRYGF